MITPVILCGGSGTRLWPRSRKAKPKPFLPLVGDTTLFEASVLRCSMEAGFSPPIVVTGAQHLDHVVEQLPDPAASQIIVEPEGKNTAAAIALAALRLPADAIMLVCPSDHHIGDCDAFQASAKAAAKLAADDWLVSFGIAATTPETGFGYLKQGDPIEGSGGRKVERFVEKPISSAPRPSSLMAAMPGTAASLRSAPGISLTNSTSTAPTSPAQCVRRWTRAMPMATHSIPILPSLPRSRANRWTMP